MFASIIGPISSLAGTWLEGKVSKAKAETDIKVAKLKLKLKFIVPLLHLRCLTNKL